jgi:hypothetical protein
MTMLVARLVTLIEEHADQLAALVARRVREDPRTSEYWRFSDEELMERARDVYAHLGRWLEEAPETEIEREYVALGRARRSEGVALSQVVMALLLVRRTLWLYVESQGADSALELRQQLDLELAVVRFFDRAVYHVVRGYEQAAD